MASTIVSRTQSGSESASGRRTFTFSAWIKRTGLGSCELFGSDSDGARSNNYFIIDFNGSNQLDISEYVSGSAFRLITNRQFRDTNGWYHLVLAVDTTQGTSSNRIKIYINGVQETSFSTENYPSQDYQTKMFAQNKVHAFGRSGGQFDGLISHCHATEGTAYAPTVFGETDSTTGEWKITTNVSVNYGTNGFFLFKDDNSVTNQAGNSSGNFAVSAGTFTKSEDCPSNVFATFNVLNKVYMNSIANANTTIGAGNNGTDYSYISATIGASSGKYYWEAKVTDLAEIDQVGVALASSNFANRFSSGGLQATTFGGKSVQFSNGNKAGDGSQSAYMGGFSVNDIIMVALDLDNNKITFGRNGQWSDGSGNADQTYANSTAAFTNLTAGEVYIPAHAMRASGGNTGSTSYNFGNGYFGTTAVSSAGTNASNNGIFEYDVPTGFTALSTKGLNL